MSESRRVLAVDEQRSTLDFLHSVLPLIEGESFEILRVLSAEEGLLELRRQPYDLLITGLRLPGMDGLELCSRAKKLRPDMATILLSGQPMPEVSAETAAFGVNHLLVKPLDAEEFLSAVQEVLSASPPAVLAGQTTAVEEPVALPSEVIRRLETLCDETGAGQVLLATATGEIMHLTGGRLQRDIPRLVAAASASVSRALDLAQLLTEGQPKVVQFVEGLTTDLYWVNVGHNYFIAILFDAHVRRGRIGTVWVFAQRAASDLDRLLADRSTGAPAVGTGPSPESPAPDAGSAQPGDDKLAEAAGQAAGEIATVEAVEPAKAVEAGEEAGEVEEPVRSPEDLALDAFWDGALAADAGDDVFGEGISLEEAKARGLVAEDFDPEGEQDPADD